MPTNHNFRVEYQINNHQIDASTLLLSLFQITQLLEIINSIENPNSNVKILIDSTEKGSFDVNLLIEPVKNNLPLLVGILSKNPEILTQIYTTFKGILEFIKFLKGNKPEKIEKLTNEEYKVTNNINGSNNTTIVTQNVFKIYVDTPETRQIIRTLGTTLDSNNSIAGLKTIAYDAEHRVIGSDTSTREDFQSFKSSPELRKHEVEEIIKENALLNILKPDLSGNQSWNFIYEGNRIIATVEDTVFINKVRNGIINFCNGDKLNCTLKIIREYNQESGFYENKSYAIIKVIENIKFNSDQSQDRLIKE